MGKTKVDWDDVWTYQLIEDYADRGMADYQIAEALGYTPEYFSKLLKKNDKILQALKKGRRPVVRAVENAMYKNAIGGYVTKTVTKRYIDDPLDPDRKEQVELVQVVETEHRPDTGAGCFILKQRKPEKYNKQPTKIDHTTDGKEIKAEKYAVIELPAHLRETEEEEE